MVCSECPMVPVVVVRDCAIPAGRSAYLQRPQQRATGFGRNGRRRGHFRFRPYNARRSDVPETQVSENQQKIASGTSQYDKNKICYFIKLKNYQKFTTHDIYVQKKIKKILLYIILFWLGQVRLGFRKQQWDSSSLRAVGPNEKNKRLGQVRVLLCVIFQRENCIMYNLFLCTYFNNENGENKIIINYSVLNIIFRQLF